DDRGERAGCERLAHPPREAGARRAVEVVIDVGEEREVVALPEVDLEHVALDVVDAARDAEALGDLPRLGEDLPAIERGDARRRVALRDREPVRPGAAGDVEDARALLEARARELVGEPRALRRRERQARADEGR